MIYVIGEKKFVHNAKELIRPKDFAIIDATDGNGAVLNDKVRGVIVKEALIPPSKVVKFKLEECEWEVDEDRVNKIWKKWLKSDGFVETIYALLEGFLKKNMNIFIIISNKAYKAIGSKYAKAINYLLDSQIKFVYTFEDYRNDKDSLTRKLSEKDISRLTKVLENDMKDNLETKWRENKHKKKHKKNRYDDDDIYEEEGSKNLGKFVKRLLKEDDIF